MSEEESSAAKPPDEKFCRKAQEACGDNACDVLSSKQAFDDDDAAEGDGGDGETGEAEEEEEIVFSTAPFDPRFPNQNQTKHCFTSFVDYKRCVKLRGDDYPPCEYFKRVYTSLCPNAWVEKWEGQLEKGTFTPPI